MPPSLTPAQSQAILDGPALTPPPGIVPNYIDPPNLYNTGAAITLLGLILSTLAVFMRLYTKARIIRQVVLSDCAILLAWPVLVGYTVISWLLNDIAPGIDQWNLRFIGLRTYLYDVRVVAILYCFVMFLVKLSILLQYIQIFAPARTANKLYWTSYTLICLNLVFYLTTVFLLLFACKPIAKSWDPLITTGHCIDTDRLNIGTGSVSASSDIIILLLPQISVWRLHMSMKRRTQISALFSVGLLTCVCSINRLAYTVKFSKTKNVIYYGFFVGIWTTLELCAGVIVACLPVLPKFIEAMKETWLFSQLRRLEKSSSSPSDTAKRRTSGSPLHGNGTNLRELNTPNSIRWPKRYETLPEVPRLAGRSSEDLIEAALDGETDRLPNAYIPAHR